MEGQQRYSVGHHSVLSQRWLDRFGEQWSEKQGR